MIPPKLPQIEEQILKYWEEHKVFEKSLEKPAQISASQKLQSGRPAPKGDFVFYDGPPFATGLPHYGHILASTIKDVIPRYKTMRGYRVRRRWGWDCHGLPIENIVEQQMGISGKKQIEERGIAQFNQACREGVLKYAAEWGKMVRRIGRWVEFENSYKTMDSSYMESVWWALRQMWDKKLIYEGRKVLLYCPRCETPISNFEVAMDNSYEEVKEEAVTIKFRIHNAPQPPLNLRGGEGELPTYFLAWTTTPWTLPGNVALAVGEEIDYVVVRRSSPSPSSPPIKGGEYSSPSMGEGKGGGEHLILAKERLAVLGEEYEIGKEMKGKDLVGLEYEPLFKIPAIYGGPSSGGPEDGPRRRRNPRVYKVYPADFVTTEDGTGIVHTAVVYGEEDYELGLKYKLPVVPLLDEKGVFNEKAPELIRGKYFKDSEAAIKDDLERRGLLFKREMSTHSYPFCWRCNTTLFYNAIPAWFIRISKIKKKLLKLNEKVNWYPEHLKHGRFQKGIEGAPDWNISRNRYWATPLPFWRCVGHNPPQPSLTSDAPVGVRLKTSDLREGADNNPPLKIRGGAGGVMNSGCGSVVCIGSLKELQERAVNYDEVYKSRDLKAIDLHRPYIDGIKLRCEKCGGEMSRIPEVVDCWVESASMPFAELHYPFENDELFKKRYPADFVAEYIAQTRAWFYVMHVVASVLFGKPPFKNVVTTGTILSETGEKLSKSKRNFPDPWEVIGRYGVDSLRLYLMTSPVMQADNLFFAEREVDNIYKKVVLLTLNVVNFYKLYASSPQNVGPGLVPGRGGAQGPALQDRERIPSSKNALDRWIVARLHETIRDMTSAMDKYDVVRAGRLIPDFVDDLSTWYLRRSRERFKGKKSEQRAALGTMSYILATFSKLLAPFMPFLAEHVWQSVMEHGTWNMEQMPSPGLRPPSPLGRGEGEGMSNSVHLTEWPKFQKRRIDATLLEEMRAARKVVELAHAARAEAKLKVRQPLQRLQVTGYRLQDELLKLIAEEVNVKEVTIIPSPPPQSSPIKGEEGKERILPSRGEEEKGGILPSREEEKRDSPPLVGGVRGGGQGEGAWVTKTDGTLTVALSTTITAELQKEGALRELTRHINEVRKIVGLTPSDRVHVMLASADPVLHGIIKEFQKNLCKSVNAASVKMVDAPQAADWSHELELDNHEKLWIGMSR